MIRNLFGGATKCRTIDKLDIFGDGSCKALYRLDGNANDESGNYHGTETAITYGGGVYERGAVFNGTSSYINTGYTFPYTAFSYSLWYKYGSVNKMIISSISTNPVKAGQFSLTQDSATQLDLEFVNNDSGTQTTLLNQTVPNMNDGLFHHIVIAIESGGFMKFYFDGSLINTSSAVPAFVNSNTTALNLMREPRNNYYKDGSLDQVRIFNRAITAPEVATLYSECEPTSIVDNINPFEDGSLKALYKFDNDATDATGVHNGVATNVTYASGKFGNCAVFNGSSSSILVNSLSYSSNSKATISCWIKKSVATNCEPIGFGDGSTAFGLALNTDTVSRVYWSNASSAWVSITGTKVINDGEWHHVCVVVEPNALLKLYTDGVLESSSAINGGNATTRTLIIGSGGAGVLNGSIDQVRIFNKALTPMEVASLYNETTPMEEPMSVQVDPFKDGSGKALYRLEGNALDESGNYNGTLINAPTYANGRFGRCLFFNGINQGVNISSLPDISVGTSSFAMSVWVKPINGGLEAANGTYSYIVGLGNTALTLGLNTNSSSLLAGALAITQIYPSSDYGTALAIISDNQWHHVVVSSNGTTLTMYVNGSNVGTQTKRSTTANSLDTIGHNDGAGGYSMNGSIDQLRIFNRALTQSEVTALYNEI